MGRSATRMGRERERKMLAAEDAKRLYWTRRAVGQCVRCGRGAGGKVFCKKCSGGDA